MQEAGENYSDTEHTVPEMLSRFSADGRELADLQVYREDGLTLAASGPMTEVPANGDSSSTARKATAGSSCGRNEMDAVGPSDLGLWHVFATATCIWPPVPAWSRRQRRPHKITMVGQIRRSGT